MVGLIEKKGVNFTAGVKVAVDEIFGNKVKVNFDDFTW